MTKRNIAIANFSPQEVFNSNWPRFTGFKALGKPVVNSGLFGLVDKDTRMHAFFKDTDFQFVVTHELSFVKRGIDVKSAPDHVEFSPDNTGVVFMNLPPEPDTSFKWLKPYTYITAEGEEWDVYVVITGKDIYINGTADRTLKTDGYWDMGIWKPTDEEVVKDTFRIEQCTINHVVELGYKAQTSITMFSDNPEYGKYQEVNVVREIPDYA